ncbi:alpha/beta hydrolase [Marinobacter sp. 71-i]|uniref:Alpha/beta hydrolase n=1 Tax=Marinobacter iranensis TaxID=2962607 RepID=A0ABT5YBC2_9GAMM|nr:alpha/beta hydrolase [Marinobacter iranensis]MDF0750977.1 alpha/beta hydrolase [Marinobacter iranensis]
MYIVTNRTVDESKHSESEAFGSKPIEGPNELRLAEVSRRGDRWHVDVLPDQITPEMAKSVGLNPDNTYPASAYVARKLIEKGGHGPGSRESGKNLLLFVHGFNNDMTDVLDRAERLEENYDVEVIVFSWPANGGGLRGVLSYKSDKRDALASVGAFNRVLEKLEVLVSEFHARYVMELEVRAEKRFKDNAAAWDSYFAKEVQKHCPFTVNMMLHSMGNYLYKHLLKSSVYNGDRLLFDNIVMVAADTNNENHAEWVDRIQYRNRLYITLNENDGALKASRLKMGEQQKARLGHYLRRLDSRVATYMDFTGQPHVGDAHAYFEETPLRNRKVLDFFTAALNGKVAEKRTRFDPSRNIHLL